MTNQFPCSIKSDLSDCPNEVKADLYNNILKLVLGIAAIIKIFGEKQTLFSLLEVSLINQ